MKSGFAKNSCIAATTAYPKPSTKLRILSKTLVPPSLGDIGLKEALLEMIENISTPELTIRMKANDHLIENLSSSKKLIIYRIVQEQINNILKHSKATESQVELKTVNNRLHLRIKDNGIGFDPSKKPGALV